MGGGVMPGYYVRDEDGFYLGAKKGVGQQVRPWVESKEEAVVFPSKMEAQAWAEIQPGNAPKIYVEEAA
jgi:hypothetical protein